MGDAVNSDYQQRSLSEYAFYRRARASAMVQAISSPISPRSLFTNATLVIDLPSFPVRCRAPSE
jgi:hypothetical protein